MPIAQPQPMKTQIKKSSTNNFKDQPSKRKIKIISLTNKTVLVLPNNELRRHVRNETFKMSKRVKNKLVEQDHKLTPYHYKIKTIEPEIIKIQLPKIEYFSVIIKALHEEKIIPHL